jgi:hypothetical protein
MAARVINEKNMTEADQRACVCVAACVGTCECECVRAQCVSVHVDMCSVCMVCVRVCLGGGGGGGNNHLVVFHRRKVDVCVGVCHRVPRAVERDPNHRLVRPFGLHNGLPRGFVRVLSSRLRSNS